MKKTVHSYNESVSQTVSTQSFCRIETVSQIDSLATLADSCCSYREGFVRLIHPDTFVSVFELLGL